MRKLCLLIMFLLVMPVIYADELVIEDLDLFIDGQRIATNENRNDLIEIFPGESMTIMIKAMNNFLNTEIEDIEIVIQIYNSERSIYYEDLERFDLNEEDDKLRTVMTTIPSNAESGMYTLLVELEGEDENGEMQQDVIAREVKILNNKQQKTFVPTNSPSIKEEIVIPEFIVDPVRASSTEVSAKSSSNNFGKKLGITLLLIGAIALIIIMLISLVNISSKDPKPAKKDVRLDDLEF